MADQSSRLSSSAKTTTSLPDGAMPPERIRFQENLTPPGSPNSRLLADTEAQYVNYREEKPLQERKLSPKRWTPLPLRTWFWIPFVLILVLGAVGLEVALHFSKKNNGWKTSGDFSSQSGVMHYVYTLPPVAVAAVFAALWAWTDIEIKKMQPYVDLVHGDSPPKRSLLLDYTRTNNFVVWTHAAYNKHYLVTLASLMVILSLTFQPLAAALLVVRDTWYSHPDVTVNTLQQIGLNQNLQFDDLSSFLTAAGYASASVLYNLPNPPFINGPYTVAEFAMPPNTVVNGTTISANTTAMRSDPGCKQVVVDMVQNTDGSGWTNSIDDGGCSISFAVDRSSQSLFGTDTVDCGDNTPDQFKPVLFWFFTYQPSAMASATLCFPSFTLWDVSVKYDLASGNITQVRELQTFSSSSNFSSLAANVTGAPLNGRAYNGIQFNLTDPDPFVLARRNATQLQMPAAVYQSAVLSPEGLVGSFEADRFVRLSSNVYRTYMTLIAKKVYFLDSPAPLNVGVTTLEKRLFLGEAATHLLAVGMLLLALFGVLIHLFHRYDRRSLHLLHEPGTIASAVAIGAQTGMGDLLAGRQGEKDISDVLKDRRFRIDPRTMKIIMAGEEGYERAQTPTEHDKIDRRRSIFAALQRQSKNGSGDGWSSPRSPRSPVG